MEQYPITKVIAKHEDQNRQTYMKRIRKRVRSQADHAGKVRQAEQTKGWKAKAET